MKPLTAMQQTVLKAIVGYQAEHGFAPTVRELATAIGLRSSSTVHTHLMNLRARGVIRYEPKQPRTIVVVPSEEVTVP